MQNVVAKSSVVPSGRRVISLNELTCNENTFLMESIIDTWGEDDQIVSQILEEPEYDEARSLAVWLSVARRTSNNELFLDVGAYTGLYALSAGMIAPRAKIFAFEPSTITFGRLARNILLNQLDLRVVPVNLAAGDSAERVTFPHRYGVYSLCSGESFDTDVRDHTQPVMIVPLDVLLCEDSDVPYLNSKSMSPWPFSKVAAIKIDVEGAETAVLSGATKLIERDRPLIIAEFLSEEAFNKLDEMASGLGYTLLKVPHERNAAMLPAEDEPLRQRVEEAFAHPVKLSCTRLSVHSLKRR